MPTTSSALRTVAFAASLTVLLAAGCSDGGGQARGRGELRNPVPSTASGETGLKRLAAQKLKWRECPAPSEAEGGGPTPSPLPGGTPWECSFMDAPLDYAEPDGETIELALIRAHSVDQQKRIGSLIFNFGGPGGSGVAALPGFGPDFADLRTRYDLVSFDPRGVGRSVPVECEGNRELDAFYARDATPDDSAEEQALQKSQKSYTDACEKNSGTELPHVGTTSAARDLDLMRQVLGDGKLHYFGISYGTELGAVYAHLFPEKVGRAVLDASVDPTKTAEQSSLGQAKGFQLAFTNFARDCVERAEKCLIPGNSVTEVQNWVIDLLQRLDEKPIPGIGERKLTQTLATTGIAQTLYSKEFWKYLEQGLDEADGGNGGLLLTFADLMNGRDQTGHYDNSMAANTAISCADFNDRYSLAQTKAKLPEFRAASPVFGDYLGWGLTSCDGWPVPGAWSHPDVSAPGAAPIIVIGSTGDPATPYEGTKAMAAALGEGVGIVLTYKGEGHGAYNGGNKCVRENVDGYLLEGRVPASGTVCE
ncbi:alpha/beta hydrolase [Streptomyces jumonjinensis]|uniref:Alpha/beta hydrolase n=1 Tax=Streptomyces jumonjinensis TaxID=1945 RepID=A0A646KRB7_STRJU|nr:alpha/beta hydrolase [Streptomyces jumonjinensis]MQT04567.1 alpha/beta hydrolase [Streptomyces jumonjinensis]